MKADFSNEDKIKCLLWSNRHCCLCGKACGTDIEIAHIIPRGRQRSWDIDNAIPLCYDCHAEIGRYNRAHPRGNKYRPEELKARRDQIYEEQTRHLVPPIQFEVTQQIVGTNTRREFPDVGYNIAHLGDSLPVRVRVIARMFLDNKDLGIHQSEDYSGKKIWNLNPRFAVYGHFKVPVEKVEKHQRLEIKVTAIIIDRYEREHELLPMGWVYSPDANAWIYSP